MKKALFSYTQCYSLPRFLSIVLSFLPSLSSFVSRIFLIFRCFALHNNYLVSRANARLSSFVFLWHYNITQSFFHMVYFSKRLFGFDYRDIFGKSWADFQIWKYRFSRYGALYRRTLARHALKIEYISSPRCLKMGLLSATIFIVIA